MLELDIIKQHCRLEPEFTFDDALLGVYRSAAIEYVENYTGRTLYESDDDIPLDEDGEPDTECALVINDGVRAAMLLMIGHWYANREAVVIGTITSEVPLAVNALLQPYRIYGV